MTTKVDKMIFVYDGDEEECEYEEGWGWIYTGTVNAENKPHGYGIAVYKDNCFLNGIDHNSDWDPMWEYHGQWVNGKKEGRGIMVTCGDNKCLSINEPYWDGVCVCGGEGSYSYGEGCYCVFYCKYDGEWCDDKRNGLGNFYINAHKSGSKFVSNNQVLIDVPQDESTLVYKGYWINNDTRFGHTKEIIKRDNYDDEESWNHGGIIRTENVELKKSEIYNALETIIDSTNTVAELIDMSTKMLDKARKLSIEKEN